MPMPKPHDGESRDKFLARCMGNATMRDEFPDRDQRFAVCNTQWRNRDKDDAMALSDLDLDADNDWETKRLTFDAEIKADEDEDGMFEGMASTFGNMDLVGDVIRRGAFKESLKRRPAHKVKMLWQHRSDEPLGVFSEMKETRQGLFVRGQLALSIQRGREAHELMKLGAIDALSIGFRVPEGGAETDKDGNRILREIDLMEVSVVTFPANPKAEIGRVKSIIEGGGFPTERQFERLLMRDAGFSLEEAKTIISRGFKHLQSIRDVAEDDVDEVIAILRESFAKARARASAA